MPKFIHRIGTGFRQSKEVIVPANPTSGGAGLATVTLAIMFEEISRGWLGLAGVLGTHTVLCDVLARFGTECRD